MSVQLTTGSIRPPSEAHSLLIRATKNCPWNRCEFCSTFKGERFQLRTVEEVKEDKEKLLEAIDRALEHWRSSGKIKRNPFLGGLSQDVT